MRSTHPNFVRRTSTLPLRTTSSPRDVRLHRFLVQSNPLFRDQHFSLPFISLPSLPHISTTKKNERGFRPKCKTNTNMQQCRVKKPTICVFNCWLNCHLASSEKALLPLEKTIDDPTPSWSAVLFCVLSHKNEIRKNCVSSCAFSYHTRGTCPVQEFSWSRNGVFLGGATKGRNAHPYQFPDVAASIIKWHKGHTEAGRRNQQWSSLEA